MSQTYDVIDYYSPFLILFEHCVMMSMLCNCYVRELLILARTWFAFGLPSKTGCDTKTIVSDRGAPFVARFWEQLQESLGTHVIKSSAYHPQTDGQTERVNQILEDMLRACVLHYGRDWDKCISLAEFSYNNSY
jgi:hypothetical protein